MSTNMSRPFLIVFLVYTSVISSNYATKPIESRISSVILDEKSEKLVVVDQDVKNAVARANFTDDISQTGWSYLTVSTNPVYDDTIQAYAAGLVEGHITSTRIYQHWINTVYGFCKHPSDYCNRLEDFIKTNIAWMSEKIENNAKDPYWHQVNLTLLQLMGMEDGYHNSTTKMNHTIQLQPFGFLLLQIDGDLEDLQSALGNKKQKRPLGGGSCSALIKMLPGNSDLYVSQVTWSAYQTMLRILKKYDFPFKEAQIKSSVIPGRMMSFSSAPGKLYSGDDFYIIGNGLVSLETTIGNSNDALWKYIKAKGQVLEWMRNIVSNRLAHNATMWADIFKQYNSGTYNNQWMVVDYNKFSPGLTPKTGLLVILEQLPGLVVAEDKTDLLTTQMYWPSYNVPYFKEIFNTSGCPENVAKYGDWFTYDKTPRAQIFRRDQSKVTDLNSMIKLMRYNDYKHDKYSKCNCTPPYSAENAISARSDLNPSSGTYPFAALGQRCHGGTDMKLTNYVMHKDLSFVAISGPTQDQQPVFQWSTSPYLDVLHLGHPDKFDFGPVQVNWKND